MAYLLSNNFEQAVGQLTESESLALISHYQGVSPDSPRQANLRLAGLLALLEKQKKFASAYTEWEEHRAAWTASPATYFSHCGASADRQARLARGECLYTANDTARAATYRVNCWRTPSSPITGWRYMPVLFWGGGGSSWRLTHPTGGSNQSTYAGAASVMNAGFPAGYRSIRIDNFPLYPRYVLPGSEVIYGLTDGMFTGGWPGLRTDQTWLDEMLAIWEPWLTGYQAAGGNLDYLFFDHEADRAFWWVKTTTSYDYHPNYNPGTTSLNDLIADTTQYSDAWLAANYMPTRAEWNNMNSWADLYGTETYRFNAAVYEILREQTAAILAAAQEVFPNCKGVDYEDTLHAGNVYPTIDPSSPHGFPLGCSRAPGTYQSRNIYSGTSLSSGTQSGCYVPGTGRVTLSRRSNVLVQPSGVTSGSTVRITFEGYNVDYTMTAGQTMLQVAQGLATAWNAVSSGSSSMVAAHTATAVDAGGGTGYVQLRPDNHWQCRIEECTTSVIGTGTLTKTVAEYGSWPRIIDDYFLLSGMVAASTMEITPWGLPQTDTSWCPFGANTYAAHQGMMAFFSGPFVFLWNSVVDATGESRFAAVLSDNETACENVIGTNLPMPIRDGYDLAEPLTMEKFINGRIVRRTIEPDLTVRTNYQPTLTTIGNKTAEVGVLLTFTAEATSEDDDVSTLTYSLLNAPTGASIHATTGVFTWTPSAGQGGETHGFTVVVTDDGPDELTQKEYIEVSVATPATNTAPTINPLAPQTATEHVLYQVTLSAEDNEDDTLTWSLETAPAGMTINSGTGQISWTPNETHGGTSPSVTVVCTDDGTPNLSDSLTFSIAVTETNTAPVLDVIPDQSGTEGTLISFQCAATDADVPAQTLTYSLPGSPPTGAAITSGGAFTWTPSSSQSGEYDITIRVTDNGSGSLYDEQSVHFVIADSNQAPVITSIPEQTVTAGELLSVQVEATDPDDDTLTYSIDDAGQVPTGLSIDSGTGLVTWTPTGPQADETYYLTVRVTDDGSPSLDATTPLTILVLPTTPVLNGIGDKTVLRGQRLAFTLTASSIGVGNPLPYFTMTGLPATATLDGETGEFLWVPSAREVGVYAVQFEVVQGESSDTEDVTITVLPLSRSSKSSRPASAPSSSAWWKFKGTGALRNE